MISDDRIKEIEELMDTWESGKPLDSTEMMFCCYSLKELVEERKQLVAIVKAAKNVLAACPSNIYDEMDIRLEGTLKAYEEVKNESE